MNKLQQLQEEGEKRIRDLSDYRFANEEARLGIIHIVRHEIMKAYEKAFKLGQISGVELAEGCIPEEFIRQEIGHKYYANGGNESTYYGQSEEAVEYFNQCRTESLTNLSDLKKNIQHE